jgi:hypothetical protein
MGMFRIISGKVIATIFAATIAGFGLIHSANAVLIDFEGLGAEGTTIGTIMGATFTGAKLVVPGDPLTGFLGNNRGGPGGTDSANSGNTATSIIETGLVTVTFGFAIQNLMFDAVDVETTEVFNANVFDAVIGGNLLHSITVLGTDPGAGDGILALIDFSGIKNIQRLEFQETTEPGIGVAGYAFDNISFEAISVPEPSILSLFALGLAGLAFVRRRHRIFVRKQAL